MLNLKGNRPRRRPAGRRRGPPAAELPDLHLGPNISSYLKDLAYAPDGDGLAAVNVSGHMRVWNASAKKVSFRLDGDASGVEFSPDGMTTATTALYRLKLRNAAARGTAPDG